MRTLFAAIPLLALSLGVGGSAEAQKAQPKTKQPAKRSATGPEALAVLPGFKVELMHAADPATEGSWICMCKDGKGRLVIAGQRGQPILRFTLADGKVSGIEKLGP